MSKLPSIPPNREKNITVDKIKEVVEVWKGDRGNLLDRVVTYRDLVSAKIGIMLRNGALGSVNVGESNPVHVNVLTNLTANGGFRLVFLDWDGASQLGYAYTEIYRNTTDNLASAVKIGTSIASNYSDTNVIGGTQYFYWVRAVSTSGHPTPFNTTAGTSATPALEPDYVIGLLAGLISESELADELLTPIQTIPTINQTLVDHDSRIDTIQTAVNDVLNLPDFDSANNYDVGDNVKHGGYAWRALQAMTNPSPTPVEGAYWTQIGAYQTYDDLLSANAAAISDNAVRITSAEGTLTTQGEDISAIQLDVTDLQNDQTATTQTINTMTADIQANEDGLTQLGQQVTLISNDLDTAEAGLLANSQNLSLQESRIDQTEDDITAQGSSIAQLENTVNDPVNGVVATANALNSTTARVDVTENDISTLGQDLTQLEATVDGQTAAISQKAEVSVVQDLENDVTSLQSKWVLQLDVDGRISGIALANDGDSSEMIIASEAVYFIDPGQSVTAFNPNTNYASIDAVRNTQLVFGYAEVEGQKRFVINVPAYIPNGTITTAQIQNATITQSQISDLSVTSAEIANAAITSAKIANIIQSDNYLQGQYGWLINKNGSAEFSDITIYDSDGNLAFASGQTYLVTSDQGAQDAGLTVNGDMTSSDENAKPLGIKLDSFDLGVMDDSYYGYADVDQTILQVNPGGNYDYTIVRNKIRVRPNETYTIRGRVRCDVGGGTLTYTLRIQETTADLSDDIVYVTPRINDSDSVIATSNTFLGHVQRETSFIDFEFTYNPPSGVKYISPSIIKPDTDAGITDLEYFEVRTMRVQVSSTMIADAAITEAKIGDASISSAKIRTAAIDTLKIQDGAVTAVSTASAADGAGNHTRLIATLIFNHGWTETIPVLLISSGSLIHGGVEGSDGIQFAIAVDDTWQGYWGDNLSIRGRGGSAALAAVVDLAPGDHTIRFYARGRSNSGSNDSLTWENVLLTAQAAKR